MDGLAPVQWICWTVQAWLTNRAQHFIRSFLRRKQNYSGIREIPKPYVVSCCVLLSLFAQGSQVGLRHEGRGGKVSVLCPRERMPDNNAKPRNGLDGNAGPFRSSSHRRVIPSEMPPKSNCLANPIRNTSPETALRGRASGYASLKDRRGARTGSHQSRRAKGRLGFRQSVRY